MAIWDSLSGCLWFSPEYQRNTVSSMLAGILVRHFELCVCCVNRMFMFLVLFRLVVSNRCNVALSTFNERHPCDPRYFGHTQSIYGQFGHPGTGLLNLLLPITWHLTSLLVDWRRLRILWWMYGSAWSSYLDLCWLRIGIRSYYCSHLGYGGRL